MAVRVAEADRHARVDPQLCVLGHLRSLVPGQRPPEPIGQGRDRARDGSRAASAPCPANAGPFFSRAAAPWPAMGGRWSSIVNRVVRSTSVPMAELPSPGMRSPSRWPGTARATASAGRSLRRTAEVTNDLPRRRLRARGTRSARPVRGHAVSSRRGAPRPCAYSAWWIASWLMRMASSSGKSCRSRREIRSGLHALAQLGPAPRLPAPVPAALPRHRRPRHRRPARDGHRPGQALLHIRPQRRVRGELRPLRPSGRPLAVPLRGAGPILQPTGPCGGVAPQLARDRGRRTPRPPRDLPHAKTLRATQRDLLALNEHRMPPGERLRRRCKRLRRPPARLPEPSRPQHRRHPRFDRRGLARPTRRDRRPEPPPVFAPRHPIAAGDPPEGCRRRPTGPPRRAQHVPTRPVRPPLPFAYRNPIRPGVATTTRSRPGRRGRSGAPARLRPRDSGAGWPWSAPRWPTRRVGGRAWPSPRLCACAGP